MKKIILSIFFLSFLVFEVISQSATVTVFSQDGEKFWVIMNGVKQNDVANTNVKVTGLTAPNYRLKIIFDDEKITSIDKDIMTRDVDNVLCDQAYVIKKDKKGKYVMRLNSFEPSKVTSSTDPNQVAVNYTEHERPAQTTTQTQQTTTTNTVGKDNASIGVNVKDPESGENINMNVNVSETGIGVNVKDPVTGENINMSMNVDVKENATTQTSVTTTTTTTTTTSSGRNDGNAEEKTPSYKMPGYNGSVGCDYPMTTQDFNEAKKSISSKSFEDSKLTLAKQITSSNCLLAEQVKEIMNLFSFEDSKLQYAKYAYTYTFDLGNYYKVNDAFTFEMSIEELNEYISKQKR